MCVAHATGKPSPSPNNCFHCTVCKVARIEINSCVVIILKNVCHFYQDMLR